MSDEIVLGDRAVETFATTGTGTVTLDGPVATTAAYGAMQSIANAVGDGVRTYYAAFQGEDWEIGIGRAHKGTGGAHDTFERLTPLRSTRPGNVLVTWGAGTKAIFTTVPGGSILLVGNLLAELSASKDAVCANIGAARTNAYLSIANALSELAASAATARSSIGAASATISGLSGGTDGKVVRLNGTSGTVVDADWNDSVEQLSVVFMKQGGLYYPVNRAVAGFTGLDPAKYYYLGDNGAMTAFSAGSSPTITTTQVRLFLGRPISSTTLFFVAGIPMIKA